VHRLIAEGQNLQHFCREAIRHVRNLLVARVCGADSPLIAAPADERPRLREQAAKFGEEDLTRFFQILLLTDDDLRRKPDPRLHLELGLLKLVNAARLAPLEEVLAELRGEGTARPTPARPASSSAAASTPAPPGAAKLAAAASASAGVPATPPVVARGVSSLSSASVLPASPPRIVAKAAEDATGGLAAAQMDAIRTALQNQKFLWSMVEHVSRWELEGSEMRLYFPTESRALAEMLQARDPMERLRTILSQVVGQPLRVCVKLESGRGTIGRTSELRTRFEEDPIVRAMLERFGGQISEVKRRSED
jgi:DNA polymerase III gamma/tau subunit